MLRVFCGEIERAQEPVETQPAFVIPSRRRQDHADQGEGDQSHQGGEGEGVDHVVPVLRRGVAHEEGDHEGGRQHEEGHHRRLQDAVPGEEAADHQPVEQQPQGHPDRQAHAHRAQGSAQSPPLQVHFIADDDGDQGRRHRGDQAQGLEEGVGGGEGGQRGHDAQAVEQNPREDAEDDRRGQKAPHSLAEGHGSATQPLHKGDQDEEDEDHLSQIHHREVEDMLRAIDRGEDGIAHHPRLKACEQGRQVRGAGPRGPAQKASHQQDQAAQAKDQPGHSQMPRLQGHRGKGQEENRGQGHIDDQLLQILNRRGLQKSRAPEERAQGKEQKHGQYFRERVQIDHESGLLLCEGV